MTGPEAKREPSLARYRLEERIGRGGMGEVFRAVTLGAGGFEKAVVVKRILPGLGGDTLLSDMFVEEARLMSQLIHPNIVQVMDFGQGEKDDYFLVMELVEGVDLGVLIADYERREQPVPVDIALFIMAQVLRGLGHAHRYATADGRTLVHRDVSPGNVLLSSVGEVKIADFGVALVTQDREGPPSVRAGKPVYMAPEQSRGEQLDARADLYAVGVVSFYLLAGCLPFPEDHASEIPRKPSNRIAPLVSSLREDVGSSLDAFVAKALAPKADDRFVDARTMMKELGRLAEAHDYRAGADEIAEIVREVAQQTQSRNRPVVGLVGKGPTEISRSEASGVFTMRLLDASLAEGSTIRTPVPLAGSGADEVGQVTPADAGRLPLDPVLSTRAKASLLVAAMVGLAALVYPLVLRPVAHPSTDHGELESDPSASHPAALSAAPPASAQMQSGPVSTASAERPGPPRPSASPGLARLAGARHAAPSAREASSTTAASAAAIAPASASAMSLSLPASSCKGDILLSSKGSFAVRGGPTTVQTPGSYRWPCGTYQLVARSREDDHLVTATVVVSETRGARARFE
ncbi:MAG: serine/threonine-protein kinase [Polyangiaceae bacterium]